MCDGWTDKNSRIIINFLVNSPTGTTFFAPIHTIDVIKDTQKMIELLDDVVEEIGVENMVQFVTNGASTLVSDRKNWKKSIRHFWFPWADHCPDLVLEDTSKLFIFHSTIKMRKRSPLFFIGINGS